MNYWKAVEFAMFLLGWYTRASRDGVITQAEIVEVVEQGIELFDIDVEIDVPAMPNAEAEREARRQRRRAARSK